MTRGDDGVGAEAALEQARALFRAGRYAEGEAFTAAAVTAHPESPQLWNVRGVMLRQLRRPREALQALERAASLDPGFQGARINAANVLLDLGEAERARAAFAELVDAEPGAAGHRVGLGRALIALGRRADGRAELRRAIELEPGLAAGWLHLAEDLERIEGPSAAIRLLDQARAGDPDNLALLEGQAMFVRRGGDPARMEAFFQRVVDRHPNLGWAQLYLGDSLVDRDPPRAETHFRRACELSPDQPGPLIALASLLVGAVGSPKKVKLAEGQRLARRAVETGGLSPNQTRMLRNALVRVWDFEGLERLDGFRTIGRLLAEAGQHRELLITQMPWVRSHADRLELLEEHRISVRPMMAFAEAHPIRRPVARPRREKIRLGFLSANFRRHPVAYFLEPLFLHRTPGFEVFCYDVNSNQPDALTAVIAEGADVFRRLGQIEPREVAQAIADDDLDILVDLGGSTGKNLLEVLAWKPAPLQASWLGYPHSTGLPTIDGFVCDPFNAPTDPGLLIERPWVLPRCWIALGPSTFVDGQVMDPTPPELRQGCVTIGTANAAYKYTPECLRAWASITAAVPGSRFVFLRPEAVSAPFRKNIEAIFAAAGVSEERLLFHIVSGGEHMGLYNEIDISLDTFPLTGGTTTVEALWMGVPVVTLRGEAFYERLSASILANAGLGELVADDLEAYRTIAVGLATDPVRRTALRAELRERLRSGPMGDLPGFARDFYALMARAVEGGAPATHREIAAG